MRIVFYCLILSDMMRQVRLNASPSADFPVMLSNGNNPVKPSLMNSPGENIDR